MPYLAPTNPEEALRLLAGDAPKIVAGCTDYLAQQGARDETLLDVTGIAGLRGITRAASGWRIGGATTWSDIVRADLPPAFDGLKRAALEVGSVQIQNRGTVAGNICNASPAADGVPPLLALDAQVEIASLRGTRHVALSDFITGVRRVDLKPDEMVVAIHIPAPPEGAKSGFIKLGSRRYLVISIVMVAAVVAVRAGRISDARIAVGSCSPVARRLPALEVLLRGQRVADLGALDFAAAQVLAPLAPIADLRGSAEYRLDVVGELCRRVVVETCKEGARDA